VPETAKRLLVIDDEPALLAAVGARLRGAGYDVRTAEGGEAGLGAARAEPPDLVVLDVRMPGMDGWDVCQAIRSDPAIASTPVLFLTGNVQERAMARAEAVGGDALLGKPYDPRRFVAAIEGLLHRDDVAAETGPAQEPDPAETTPGPPTTTATGDAEPCILIVDNDEDLAAALVTRLESLGHRCELAGSGRQAMSIYQSTPVNLVVTDLNMPGGDGVTLARSLRERGDVPIIVLTGFRGAFRDRLAAITNLTVLEKPCSTQHLIELVETELLLDPV